MELSEKQIQNSEFRIDFSILNRLFKQSFTYVSFDFLRRSLGFLLIPIYTRALLPQSYGILFVLNLFTGLLGIIFSLGLNVSLYNFYEEDRRSFSTIFYPIILYTLLFSFLLLFFTKFISSFLFNSTSFGYLLPYAIAFAFVDNLLFFFLTLSKIKQKPFIFGFFSTTKFLVNVVLNIVFVVYLKQDVLGILKGNLISSGVVTIIALPFFFSLLHLSPCSVLLKKMLKFGLPLVPGLLFLFLLDLADRFMLEKMTSLSRVGIYSLGYQFGASINLIVSGFRMAWGPFIFSVRDRPGAKGLYARALPHFLYWCIFAYFVLVLFTGEIFKIFVGSAYLEGASLVWIIGLAYVWFGIFTNFSTGLYIRGKTAQISILFGIALLANIVLNLLLIPHFEIKGAAYATLFAYIILAFTTYFAAQRSFEIGYETTKLLVLFISVVLILILNPVIGVSIPAKVLILLAYASLYFWLRKC